MDARPDRSALAREWRGERSAVARADRNALLAIAALLALSTVTNSLSVATEFARMGDPDPALAWLQEGSSHFMLLVLTPAIMWAPRRLPLTADNWRRAAPVYLALTLPYSAVHVLGMVAIRWAVHVMAGEPYHYDFGVWAIYEYRKDVFSFCVLALIILGSRELEAQRQEAQAAREDARKGRRLTLKCGGRTIWIEADALISAHAAGNYVEVRTATGQHLARITLSALEKQLAEAGVDAVRVHRSWLVNRDKVVETAPAGSGDVTYRMADGSEAPGSRRFRDGRQGLARPR